MSRSRRLPVGAEMLPAGDGVSFRVWAPKRSRVELALEDQGAPRRPAGVALRSEGDGYFSAVVASVRVGDRYGFRLDDDDEIYPDPASRFQPDGPHGLSAVVDTNAFRWTDGAWQGVSARGQIIYEMHIGTFTKAGTWEAAANELPELKDLGVTVIEMMPIADFSGAFGWGYDGVALYAPTRIYGKPDDLRAFVDRAHSLGIGVILDVVYNHLGPDGNYLGAFSDSYFTDRYVTDWGSAINFDGDGSGPVRDFFVGNAGYWIDEFHFDGLRLDATQNIYDNGDREHILAAVSRRVREAARGRETMIVAENEPQEARLLKPLADDGFGLDGVWNDDFHHSAMVALTKNSEAYFTDYRGSPQELVSAMKRGYLYQGQNYSWQKKRRGTAVLHAHPSSFITFLQNHDQIANSLRGDRISLLASGALVRALTAFTLLGPGTPMLFQGEEFAASSPFLFFADHAHAPELAKMVRKGRGEFLMQFPSMQSPEAQALLRDPSSRATFDACKLDFGERSVHAETYAFYKDLLALRQRDAVLRAPDAGTVDGAVLSEEAFCLRTFGTTAGDDRLLVVNLGRELLFTPCPEPLLGAPEGMRWSVLMCSEDSKYGGHGVTKPEDDLGRWHIAGQCAFVLAAVAAEVAS